MKNDVEPSEPEYAADPVQKRHRIASACVLAVWVFLTWHARGFGPALKTFAAFFLPMGCIWFPEVLENYRGTGLGGGTPIDAPSPARFLRWAGWFVLLFVPLIVMAIAVSQRGR